MKFIPVCLFLIVLFGSISCSPRLMSVIYHDTSGFDDGDFFGGELNNFFRPDSNVKNIRIRSWQLNKFINCIRDSVAHEGKSINDSDKVDDAYYDYVFINSCKDTFYSQNLRFWRFGSKDLHIEQPIVDTILKQYFKF